MLISEVYTRLAEFIVLTVNDPTISVIFANQNSPRPKKPFITIAIGALNDVSFPMKYDIDANGIQDVIMNKSFIATMEAYCDGLHQSEEILNNIQNEFRTDFSYYHFRADMVYIKTIMGVSAVPVPINGINESRAILEVEFSLNQLVRDDVGLIDHIEILDEITGNNIIIDR
jgi:hypothetical protein